jgi:hypothetical protein
MRPYFVQDVVIPAFPLHYCDSLGVASGKEHVVGMQRPCSHSQAGYRRGWHSRFRNINGSNCRWYTGTGGSQECPALTALNVHLCVDER